MTDWETITANIINAMQAVDKAQQAGELLRNDVNLETLDKFKEDMEELCEQLSALKYVLDRQSKYSMEELVDLLSTMFSGQPASYRSIPPIKSRTEQS